VNSRPLKEDWQDMPSTVKEIMRLKEDAKTMPRRRKRKKNKGLFVQTEAVVMRHHRQSLRSCGITPTR